MKPQTTIVQSSLSFSAAKLLHHPQRVTAQTWAERMGQGWGINIHHNSHPQIPKNNTPSRLNINILIYLYIIYNYIYNINIYIHISKQLFNHPGSMSSSKWFTHGSNSIFRSFHSYRFMICFMTRVIKNTHRGPSHQRNWLTGSPVVGDSSQSLS